MSCSKNPPAVDQGTSTPYIRASFVDKACLPGIFIDLRKGFYKLWKGGGLFQMKIATLKNLKFWNSICIFIQNGISCKVYRLLTGLSSNMYSEITVRLYSNKTSLLEMCFNGYQRNCLTNYMP